ncbi:hypothetical protein QBC35DRAFT_478754 [Podospora australis]|uniref:Uncharacterized protein n=1 Tax=Podospora australis TaxID=1536484 RepID=A0AAN7AEE5_9PEZI|nr:hypothetical protein QBC35DRAFT_478754 [Podospora australis]
MTSAPLFPPTHPEPSFPNGRLLTWYYSSFVKIVEKLPQEFFDIMFESCGEMQLSEEYSHNVVIQGTGRFYFGQILKRRPERVWYIGSLTFHFRNSVVLGRLVGSRKQYSDIPCGLQIRNEEMARQVGDVFKALEQFGWASTPNPDGDTRAADSHDDILQHFQQFPLKQKWPPAPMPGVTRFVFDVQRADWEYVTSERQPKQAPYPLWLRDIIRSFPSLDELVWKGVDDKQVMNPGWDKIYLSATPTA